jgi:hypothetical protein
MGDTRMKNITLSADEKLIDQARLVAQARQTTLDEVFREWLKLYVEQANQNGAAGPHCVAFGPYTRDQMNER